MIRDVFWGIGWGLAFAVFFSLVAVAMTVLSGGETIERQGVSLAASIGVYFLGGITGGTFLGLLRPLTKRRIGSAVVGFLVMIPANFVLWLVIAGPVHTWGKAEWIALVLGALMLGVPGGYFYWEPPEDRR